MNEPFSHNEQMKAFINTAPYLAGLTSGQDIWEEAAKVLVRFFGADFAAFGRYRGNGKIEICNRAYSENGAKAGISEQGMIAAICDVFESGLLTCISSPTETPTTTAFFPMLHQNSVIAVMLVGHLSVHQLSREALDLYLAVAKLVGVTYSRDIAARAVYQAKEEWERTFEAVPDMIALIDTEHRIVRVNRAMAAGLGMSREECAGLACYSAIHGTDEPPAYCPYRLVLEDGMEHAVETHEERLGGDFLVSAIPLNDEREVMIGSVHIAYDITDRKLAEEQLKQKKQLLEELNRTLEKRVYEEVEKNREKDIMLIQQNRMAALGEMFDHIAHQWKQPLNTIAVIMQALGSTSAHEQVTARDILETVDNIMDMVEHMAQTVEVFRNFYKPDKEKSAFLVKDSIDKALTFITPVFRRYGIEVDLDADAELLAFGYPKEYVQVLLNILANAKDAVMEKKIENPRISIKALADGDNTVVIITDNAGGIPAGSLERIFDLYFTTKESRGGTGIGLYISRNIIEKNMGGELTVSNVNNGAQFRIELGKS